MNELFTERVNEDLVLTQNRDGLLFGTDAYLLAACVKPDENGTAVELGAGNGIVSLLLAARRRFSSVVCVEITPSQAELCEENVQKNGLSDRVRVLCRDLRGISGTNDLPAGLPPVRTVLCNPPYMTAVSGPRNENEVKYTARHEVNGNIGDFAACAARLLGTGGSFTVVWRPDRLESLFAALKTSGFAPKEATFVQPDADSAPSLILVRSVKGAAEGLRLTPPLLLHDTATRHLSPRPLSAAAERVYETMRFPSGK